MLLLQDQGSSNFVCGVETLISQHSLGFGVVCVWGFFSSYFCFYVSHIIARVVFFFKHLEKEHNYAVFEAWKTNYYCF